MGDILFYFIFSFSFNSMRKSARSLARSFVRSPLLDDDCNKMIRREAEAAKLKAGSPRGKEREEEEENDRRRRSEPKRH